MGVLEPQAKGHCHSRGLTSLVESLPSPSPLLGPCSLRPHSPIPFRNNPSKAQWPQPPAWALRPDLLAMAQDQVPWAPRKGLSSQEIGAQRQAPGCWDQEGEAGVQGWLQVEMTQGNAGRSLQCGQGPVSKFCPGYTDLPVLELQERTPTCLPPSGPAPPTPRRSQLHTGLSPRQAGRVCVAMWP